MSKAVTNILIVEDDEDIRECLIQILELEGYTISAVGSGTDGLAFLRNQKPHLILLDVMLPDMSGGEFIEQVKADPGLAALLMPIVIMSAAGEPAQKIATSVNGYLKKPIDIETLINTVSSLSNRA